LVEDWRLVRAIRRDGGVTSVMNPPKPNQQELIQWEKPTRSRYKCNIDVSFSSSLNKVGIGMRIWDYAGEFVLAKTDWFSPLCDVVIGETVGLHTILQGISDLQFDNVDFVLDSQWVMDSFHTCVYDNSEFGCINNICR